MSSRSLPVRLSKKARQDFIDILRYTGQTWGPNQLEVYRDKIDDALQALGHNPELGHKREDLPTTHAPTWLAHMSWFTGWKIRASASCASCTRE
jgi:plasmid stabilization system protein ParE